MALFGRPTRQDSARAAAYREWFARRNPMAIASLVLGIFSMFDLGVLIAPEVGGIVLGGIALAQLRRIHYENGGDVADGRNRGQRLAYGGIALSILSLLVAAALYWQNWRR